MTDFLLAAAIIIGAVYVLYRSVWKKRGYCPGCDSETCPTKPENKSPDSKFSGPEEIKREKAE